MGCDRTKHGGIGRGLEPLDRAIHMDKCPGPTWPEDEYSLPTTLTPTIPASTKETESANAAKLFTRSLCGPVAWRALEAHANTTTQIVAVHIFIHA